MGLEVLLYVCTTDTESISNSVTNCNMGLRKILDLSEKNRASEIQVRLHLKGAMSKRFKEMKDYYGFEHNADLVRKIIVEAYEQFKRGQKDGLLPR